MNQKLGYQYLSQIQSPVEIKGSISVNSSPDSGLGPISVWEVGFMGALILAIIVGGILWCKLRPKSNTVVLSEVLKNLKKEIRAAQNPKECQEDQKPDRLAQGSMFSFGTVTVTLQTIVDQKGEIRLITIPKNESWLSAQIRQENTQSLTLQLNPLKVVDGEDPRRVIVNFSSQNGQSKIPKEWSNVIQADFVEIGNIFYLWLMEENHNEYWIKASDIEAVTVSGKDQETEHNRLIIWSEIVSE